MGNAAIQDQKNYTSATEEAVVEVSHAYKAFGEKKVLTDFNLTLYSEESLVVLGKSGSGKSVLLKCISGLMKPDTGTIKVFGKELGRLDRHELNRIRGKIGYLFQYSALYDSMTIRDNLAFPLRRHYKEKGKNEVRGMIEEALDDVGLPDVIDMMPADLSGGMKKRVALARAIIMHPTLMLYDEPTAGLDPKTTRDISHLMVEVQEKYKASAIIITHDIACAEIVSDRVIVLGEGRPYAQGTLEELRRSDDQYVKEFF